MTYNLNSAWDALISKYSIVDTINSSGYFVVSAEQMKEFFEPRQMAKFDSSIQMPSILRDNQISILPIKNGLYLLSRHKIFESLDIVDNHQIDYFEFPEYITSINVDDIPSEAKALNVAYISGIIEDFVEDKGLFPTVNGRMRSGVFRFLIHNEDTSNLDEVLVENAQIEIDGAYEGIDYLTIVEAKKHIPENFIVRQLYYPFRTWLNKIHKPIKLVYFIHSNSIFYLLEYRFDQYDNYSSISLVKQKRYSVENTHITHDDLNEIANTTRIVEEENVPFPQADSFPRVISLLEYLSDGSATKSEITTYYNFDERQSDYYSNALIYLGLAERAIENHRRCIRITQAGKRIISMNYVNRQLSIVARILAHSVFNEVFLTIYDNYILLTVSEIYNIMSKYSLYGIDNISTRKRRASTVYQWIKWILSLVSDD